MFQIFKIYFFILKIIIEYNDFDAKKLIFKNYIDVMKRNVQIRTLTTISYNHSQIT